MDKTTETRNEFLEKMREKYGMNGETIPKAKEIRVEGLVNDMNSFPGRLKMVNTIGKTSVKNDEPNMNKLHGKDGKKMVEDDEDDDEE